MLYSDDPDDWAPVLQDDLILVNARTGRFHLPSCKWAQEMSPRNARYYLTVNDARLAGCSECNTCSPSRHHDQLLSTYSTDQLLTAYRQVMALSIEREVNHRIRQALATPESIEELLQNEYRLVETESEKWPQGRLVGATIRLRWSDGYIGSFRLVDGDDEQGNGRDTISLNSRAGHSILAGEVGDTFEYQGQGVAGMPGDAEAVTILSITVPDDWAPIEC